MDYNQLDYLTKLFEQEITDHKLGGCSLIVEHKETVVYHKAFGSDQSDSIYRIYSMTKPVTSVATMILYERGMLDLMEPVSNYLKGFEKLSVFEEGEIVPAKTPITIQNLLNMTSGLVYPNDGTKTGALLEGILVKAMKNGAKTVEICDLMGTVPLHFQPGEKWYYGSSADVLGAIIEVCSGMKLSEFMKKEIFDPLQMKDTGFVVPKDQVHRLASMYMMDSNKKVQIATKEVLAQIQADDPTKEPFMEMGGGGLFSTAADYLQFARMLLHGGTYEGVRILGKKTVESMAQNQLNDVQRSAMWFDSTIGYGYGNLFRVLLELDKATSNGSIGEFGWDGLPGNYFCVDPKEELLVVYMQQNTCGADQSTRRRMRNIIYGAI